MRDVGKLLRGQAANASPSLKVLAIVGEVAQRYQISLAELLSDSHSRRLCLPRHEAMYLARLRTSASLPVIGATMNRDHTSVLHGIRKHQERMGIAAPNVSRETIGAG